MVVVLDIDLRLKPNVEAPAEARRSLGALRPSLDDLLVDDAVLLVSEIVSNSVRHASLDASDAIEVRIRGSRSMLHVDVDRSGSGIRSAPRSIFPGERRLGAQAARPARNPLGGRAEPRDEGVVRARLVGFRRSDRGYLRHNETRRCPVGEKTDKAKGHVKETVGDLTDDERLEREGKLDQASGDVKGAAEDAKDKVGEGVDAVRDRLKDD